MSEQLKALWQLYVHNPAGGFERAPNLGSKGSSGCPWPAAACESRQAAAYGDQGPGPALRAGPPRPPRGPPQ